MPREGKEPFGLHLLHDGLPFDVLIAGVRDVAARDLARNERAIQFHAKPLAELMVIGKGAPDSGNRRVQFNTLLNSMIHVKQPLSCILAQPDWKCNRSVALSCRPTWQLPASNNPRLYLHHAAGVVVSCMLCSTACRRNRAGGIQAAARRFAQIAGR